MPTNPLPAGTVNFPVNMRGELRRKLGRLAVALGKPSGAALVRELIEGAVLEAERRGIELARDARQALLPWALCLVVFFGFFAVGIGALTGMSDPRRPVCQRVVRSMRTARGSRREGEGA